MFCLQQVFLQADTSRLCVMSKSVGLCLQGRLCTSVLTSVLTAPPVALPESGSKYHRYLQDIPLSLWSFFPHDIPNDRWRILDSESSSGYQVLSVLSYGPPTA